MGKRDYGQRVKDKCVTCGIESIYNKKEHIKFRIGYIVGVGQLCFDCLGEIYYSNQLKVKDKNEERKVVRLR